MLKSRALVLAKIESSYGVDPVPIAASDAIMCEAPEFEVLGRKLERNNVKSYFGTLPPINIGEGLKVSFSCELKGSGSAGIAPRIDPLLRACGMKVTNTPVTSHVYTPSSGLESEQQSCAIYFYQHNILHKLLGCRGTWELEGAAGDYGKIKFDMTGLYCGPAHGLIPASPVFENTLPPRLVSASFTLGSYAAIISTFKAALGNTISKRSSANAATGILSYFIGERAVTGEIDPEAVELSSWNPWTLWENSAAAALSITFGSSAGNRCVVTGPKVMLDSVKYADRETLLTYAAPLIFTPDNGNDEIALMFN